MRHFEIALLSIMMGSSPTTWNSSVSIVKPIQGAPSMSCKEARKRHEHAKNLLDEIQKIDTTIERELDGPTSAVRTARVDRWNRKREDLQSQLSMVYPQDLQTRDYRVTYAFDAPLLSAELAAIGSWTPGPGLRTQERLETTQMAFGETVRSDFRSGELVRDAQGNRIPSIFALERDAMGRDHLEIRFERFLNLVDLCLGDLSVQLQINRRVSVDDSTGTVREFEQPALLSFTGEVIP